MPLTRVRLVGMHFDTNKCFLRETAMTGIQSVVQVYKKQPNGKMLIVGHTDPTADDAYNLDLSVERAETVKAYLKDDVAAWEAWFGEGKPKQKRWGDVEVHEMISALPCERTVAGFQAWSNATRGTDLKVDSIAGPKTRKALIQAYMAIDGTSTPNSVTIETHGCGEFFPIEGASNDENRRVEIYCFDDVITPPVPGPKATKGEPEYEQWKKQVTETTDVSATPTKQIVLRLLDDTHAPMAVTPYRALWGPQISGESDDNGMALISVPEVVDELVVEWGKPTDEDAEFRFRQIVQCPSDASDDDCLERLQNLGFRSDDEGLSQAVARYQRRFQRDETASLADIRDEMVSWHDGGSVPT